MTSEDVCTIFYKNPFLTLPVKVDASCSVLGELEKRWDQFAEFLHHTEALHSCIKPTEFSREKITEAFKSYYSGEFGKASECLFNIVDALVKEYGCEHLITDANALYVDDESKQWFRARKGNSYPFGRDDMRHIPTDKRELIENNRYSANGIPCLYLANSILACWEELNRPSLDSFWVSRFWPSEGIRVLNLSMTGYEVIYAYQNIRGVGFDTEKYSRLVIEFFSTWVLQSACSVVVHSEANRPFKEEYLIPQLLMTNVKRLNVDGVMYSSTKMLSSIAAKTDEPYLRAAASWIAKTIAVPAFDAITDSFSKRIDELFHVSLPINIGLYQNGLLPHFRLYTDDNGSRTYAPAFAVLVPTNYGDTIFYECERELRHVHYGLPEGEGGMK